MCKLAFRAWDVFTGGYTYSDKYGNLAKFFEYCQKCIDGGNMIIFEQYTGLKDKNGREIYEGDIVNINHPDDLTGDFTNTHGRVFWWETEGGFFHGHESPKKGSGRPPKRMWEYVEVIGNEFENKELLK